MISLRRSKSAVQLDRWHFLLHPGQRQHPCQPPVEARAASAQAQAYLTRQYLRADLPLDTSEAVRDQTEPCRHLRV